MNKPKGIWVRGDRLWVTDIDAVWIFDTRTKKGRRLALPGVVFANDPAVMGNALGVSGQIKKLSDPIGRLDGAYEMADGSLLLTDWDSGSLFHRAESGERRKIADGFKGPADFCVLPQAGGLTVYVPDLVQSQPRK